MNFCRQISTCTWRLNNIHLVHQSGSGKSCLRLVADDLNTDECSAIPWDEFQVRSHIILDHNEGSLQSHLYTCQKQTLICRKRAGVYVLA